MTRRGFLKWLLTGAIAAFAGWLAWLLKGSRLQQTAPPPAAATPSPTPVATPSPTPSPSPTPKEPGSLLLSLFLFSDMHITIYDETTANKLRLALDDVTMLDSKVEAIVFGGDLTDFGRENDYNLLRSVLDDYKLPPLYGNMGNHDYYHIWLTKEGAYSAETVPNGKTDQQSRERFQEFLGMEKPYGETTINGVHLILLSQETYVQEKEEVKEGAWYSDEQLAWFEETLKSHSDGSPALVFIHQPLPAAGSDGGTHRMIRANRFREIVKPYPNVCVFSGHTHRNFNTGEHYTKESFHWFTNSSVGRLRTSESQGMYIQVYENQVAVRGREFSTRQWLSHADWKIELV